MQVRHIHGWMDKLSDDKIAMSPGRLGLGLGIGLQVLYSVTNCTGNILGRFTNITSKRTRLLCSRHKQYTHLNTITKKQN